MGLFFKGVYCSIYFYGGFEGIYFYGGFGGILVLFIVLCGVFR